MAFSLRQWLTSPAYILWLWQHFVCNFVVLMFMLVRVLGSVIVKLCAFGTLVLVFVALV